MGKFVGATGLAYLWEKIKALVVGKADKISEVNHGTSDTTFTLTPNVMHIWGKVTSLTLSLPTDSDSYLDEYLITFTAGANFQMYLPNTVKWVQELETEEDKVYQVSIQYNLAGWLTNDMPTGGGGGGGAGDVNIIESISVNGVQQTVTNKNVDIDVPTDLADLSDDTTHRLVTDTEKSAWDAKGTYSKPSGGIPSTDLSSDVQASLDKADTALQSFTESDPTVPSWAKQSTKPSYTASEIGAVDVNDVVTIYSGSSTPSASLGKNGDIYIKTS